MEQKEVEEKFETDLTKIPKLGFGFMRLPMKEDKIDLEKVCQMVDNYMEHGFVYFDTAYVYHNGESEVALREALVKRYPREAFLVADKLPAWNLKNKEDAELIFQEQLKRTGLSYFDFYLLHCISLDTLKIFNQFDCWNYAHKLKELGLIKHFGFSFHDTPEVLDQVLNAHPEVDFVQLQINYADWDNNKVNSRLCYEIAQKYGKRVIVMEPVKGGTLAFLPSNIEEMLRAVSPNRSTASWAMRFCASLESVMVVLSGMSNEEQLGDNLATMKNFEPFSEKERESLEKVREILAGAPTIACTACNYCVDGCPSNIKIPNIFGQYNSFVTYGNSSHAKENYENLVKEGHCADLCVACGSCESVCPQHLPIIELLKNAKERFQ